MSLVMGAQLLGAVGHLANFGQFVEIGQSHAYQRAQMRWARRAYCLDSRALRIDILNAVKEDLRDIHQTYAGRIDTLLVVHTLLLTFALATLQYSEQFVPSSDCEDCVEADHPWLVTVWVYAVSLVLILPFWSIVMLIWSKLQLDRWLEESLGRLNLELRSALSSEIQIPEEPQQTGPPTDEEDRAGQDLLEHVEASVKRLGAFVEEHQENFKQIWTDECHAMINAAAIFLWVSCGMAIAITAGMFWLFLRNNMQGQHGSVSTHFACCTTCGLLAPLIYFMRQRLTQSCSIESSHPEVFEDCVEMPATAATMSFVGRRVLPSDLLLREEQTSAEQPGKFRSLVRRLTAAVARPARRRTSAARPGGSDALTSLPSEGLSMSEMRTPTAHVREEEGSEFLALQGE